MNPPRHRVYTKNGWIRWQLDSQLVGAQHGHPIGRARLAVFVIVPALHTARRRDAA
jgi:hypothetical protein